MLMSNLSSLKSLNQTHGNFDVLNRDVYKFDAAHDKIRDLHIENVEFEIA